MRELTRSFVLIVASLFITVTLAGAPLVATAQDQIPRNELGVTFDHVSVVAPGPLFEQETEFWQKLGGQPRQVGAARFVMFGFPDMVVTVQDMEGSGGTVGSVIDHIGFQVPKTADAVARFKAAGLNAEAGGFPGQGWVTTPTGIRVEILEDPQLAMPIRGHHVHFFVTAPLEMQAWYAKHFGAIPGKRGNFDAANVTANMTVINLTFSLAETARASTKGRALSRVGFFVTDIEAFLKKLQAENVVTERSPQLQAGRTRVAFFLDPWGTWVELIDRNAGSGQP